MIWIAAAGLVYTAGFTIFYPEVLASTDESLYIEQAIAFAGRAGSPGVVSEFPPGTSLLQAPFVLLGGWRAAVWASVLCLAVTLILLGRWLTDAGYRPAAALLFAAYAPTLVLGRTATSDLPSAALVTAGLWLFWTGERHPTKWFWAGLIAGVSVLFRETNALIFLPFIAAAVWRRERGWRMLTAGVALGIGLRLLTYQLLFGSAVATRDTAGWSIAAVLDSSVVYGFALLLLVPGGLVAVGVYRGRHWRQLLAAVVLYVSTYLFYNYSGQSSDTWVRVAAAGRYLIPLLPLVTIAWADAAQRYGQHRAPRGLAVPASALVLVAAFAVHPVVWAWSARDAAVVRDIYRNSADGDALIVSPLQRKYVSPLYGPRTRVWMEEEPVPTRDLTDRHPATFVIIVDRMETERLAMFSVPAREYVARARNACELDVVHDRRYPGDRHLQMWKVHACRY